MSIENAHEQFAKVEAIKAQARLVDVSGLDEAGLQEKLRPLMCGLGKQAKRAILTEARKRAKLPQPISPLPLRLTKTKSGYFAKQVRLNSGKIVMQHATAEDVRAARGRDPLPGEVLEFGC